MILLDVYRDPTLLYNRETVESLASCIKRISFVSTLALALAAGWSAAYVSTPLALFSATLALLSAETAKTAAKTQSIANDFTSFSDCFRKFKNIEDAVDSLVQDTYLLRTLVSIQKRLKSGW
jgi:hypothetical protein